MMRVELIKNCNVRFPKGTVLNVSDAEARRLTHFNLATVKPVARKKQTEEKPDKTE